MGPAEQSSEAGSGQQGGCNGGLSQQEQQQQEDGLPGLDSRLVAVFGQRSPPASGFVTASDQVTFSQLHRLSFAKNTCVQLASV